MERKKHQLSEASTQDEEEDWTSKTIERVVREENLKLFIDHEEKLNLKGKFKFINHM